MVVRQPLLQRRWQQQLLVGFVRKVGLLINASRYWTGPIIPPNTRQPCFSDGLLGTRWMVERRWPEIDCG